MSSESPARKGAAGTFGHKTLEQSVASPLRWSRQRFLQQLFLDHLEVGRAFPDDDPLDDLGLP